MKACPFCAEEIQEAAIVCKHCGRDLVPHVTPKGNITPAPPVIRTKRGIWFAFKIVGFAIAVFMAAIVVLVVIASNFASSASSRASQSSTPLIVLVHRGTRGLRITNDTESTFDRCSVQLPGDYSANLAPLVPRGVVEVYYEEFKVGSTPLNTQDGYARAIRGTRITCSDADDRRVVALER